MSFLPRGSNFNSKNRADWVRRIAQSLPPGARILDAGAGCGPYRALFAHCRYETQDFGQETNTRGKYTALTYECDITAIPAPSASYDAILCTEVLEHVPEPARAIQEFSRLLKSGGKLFLSAPLGSHIHQEPYHFYGGFTRYWYERFVPQAGFEIDSIETNQGFFSLVGQELSRFNSLLNPFAADRTLPTSIDPREWRSTLKTLMRSAVWLATAPAFKIVFPPLCAALDRQFPSDGFSTVGYHVIAHRAA